MLVLYPVHSAEVPILIALILGSFSSSRTSSTGDLYFCGAVFGDSVVRYSDGCHYAVYRGFAWYFGIRIFKEQRLMHSLPAVCIVTFILLQYLHHFCRQFFVLPGFITIPEFRDILAGNTPVKAGKAGYFY